MIKAVIKTGSKQYLVSEGDVIKVELIKSSSKNVNFEPLLVIDDANVSVGTPLVDKISVSGEIIEADVKEDKVTSIRYKAKKRVHKTRGHRQRLTHIKINKIA
jgi:large subunit ribosomal protein L21